LPQTGRKIQAIQLFLYLIAYLPNTGAVTTQLTVYKQQITDSAQVY